MTVASSGSPAATIRTARANGSASPIDYLVYGGVLRSTLVFPELRRAAGGEPTWHLDVTHASAPARECVEVGHRTLGREWYRLGRTATGWRLEYSHAGVFELSSDGTSMRWFAPPDQVEQLARSVILGPLLALALEMSGRYCLHGSAVAVGGRAIAFIGPKHHGKSTLAMALTSAGARFVADDTLAITVSATPMLEAGVPSIRLWQDAFAALRPESVCGTVIEGVKAAAWDFDAPRVACEALPLSAIYVLAPVTGEAAAKAVIRDVLAPSAAVVALAHHAKLPDSLVGLERAAGRFRLAAALAATVPVRELRVARSFEHLPEVARRILAWHRREAEPRP